MKEKTMPPKTPLQPLPVVPQGRINRVMQILAAMSQDERAEFFDEVGSTYCTACGEELPDENSKEPDHDCPYDDEDDDGGDEECDEEGPEEDEEDEDEEANEP